MVRFQKLNSRISLVRIFFLGCDLLRSQEDEESSNRRSTERLTYCAGQPWQPKQQDPEGRGRQSAEEARKKGVNSFCTSRMSEAATAVVSGAAISEDPEGATGGSEQPSPPEPGPLRCGSCALWPRQQTWLCVVPLLIGFIGLGLSLMLLKWIVVGSVKDYVPTDLVDAKGIGQDPIFLSKPSALPKNSETTTTTTTVSSRTRPGLGSHSTTTASSAGAVVPASSGSFTPRPPNRISTRITTTTTRAPRLLPPGGRGVTPRGTTVRRVTTGSSAGMESAVPSGAVSATTEAGQEPTTPPSPSPSGRFYLHDSTAVWTLSHFPAERIPAVPTRPSLHTKTCEFIMGPYC
ncbi:NRG3 protein, partial [Polyodon spathula]|nr:NRG3 protein [Polyodon spathula]